MLMAKGYRILGLRAKTPKGEIDLIALRGRRLVFVEVKRRLTLEDAEASITPRQRERNREHLAGSRDADVTEPALFVDRLVIQFQGSLVRQDSFLHADQIDTRKLQPLRAMERHQRNGVTLKLRIFIFTIVALVEEHIVQEAHTPPNAQNRTTLALALLAS